MWRLIPARVLGAGLAVLMGEGAAAEPVHCDSKLIIKSCEDLKRLPPNLNGVSELGIPKFEDGAEIPNYVSSRSAPIRHSPTQAEALRKAALRTGELVRKNARAAVIGETDPAKLSSEQKIMLERLKSVSFKVLSAKECDQQLEQARRRNPRRGNTKNPPQAFYVPDMHIIALCESTTRLASPVLTRVLAHELGHAAGLCSCTNPLHQVSPEAQRPAAVERCMATAGHPRAKTKTMSAPPAGAPVLFSSLPGPIMPQLSKCGLAKKVLAARPSEKSTLFAKTQACLDNAYRQSWKRNRQQMMAMMAEGPMMMGGGPMMEEMMFDEYADDFYPGSYAGGFANSFGGGPPPGMMPGLPPGFDSLQCHPGHEEHWADTFSLRVIHQMLASGDFPSEHIRASLVFMGALACHEKTMSFNPSLASGHPPSSKRLLLGMTDPLVQSALGCRPDPGFKMCSFADGWGASSGARASTQQTGARRSPVNGDASNAPSVD